MEIDLFALLWNNHTLVFFLVLGLGYLAGNIRVGQFQLGPTSGVLLAGLFFGHFGFSMNPAIQEIGFILFIYSVGFQAGPRFFNVFLEDGMKYALLSIVVALTAITLAEFLSGQLGFNPGLAGGLLAGALTSTPTLAAAQDVVTNGLVAKAQGGVDALTATQMLEDLSEGYAITYLFGTMGLIAFIRLMPRLLRFDLASESKALAKKKRLDDEPHEHSDDACSKPMIRAFEVMAGEMTDRPLKDIHLSRQTGCVIQEVKRDGDLFKPDGDTVLSPGDRVSVVGPLDKLETLSERLGQGIFDGDLLKAPIDSATVIISGNVAPGKRISELHTVARYGCFVSRIIRAQIELPLDMDILLEKGDVVTLSGGRERLKELVDILGHQERTIVKTDLVTFAFGIVAGLFIGGFTVKIGTVSFGLGNAGGLLISGIVIGFLRSLHPTFGRVPPAARWILMELGLMFFMAGVGLKAGKGIVEALLSVGAPLFLSGVVITLVPVFVGFAFGRWVLRLNPALLMGALTGAMTSTPALNVVTQDAKSHLPALGYAGTYTFANVFLALGGTLMMIF